MADSDDAPDGGAGVAREKAAEKAEAKAIVEVAVTDLRAAMKDMQRIVESRNTIPILENVLLRSDGNRLSLTATDLDMMAVRDVPVQKAQGLATTVGAKLLGDIAKKLPAEALATLTLSGGKLVITAARARFTLPTLPVDDFPIMPAPDGDVGFELCAAAWTLLIDSVRGAMANEEARYYLNGIHLHALKDGRLSAAATDGHRLAVYRMAMPDGGAALPPIILGRKAVGVVASLLDDIKPPKDGGESPLVSFETDGRKALFDIEGVTLITKLIDGQFPDYTRVIPTGNDKQALFDPAQLAEAADRVAVVSTEKTRAIKALFERGDMLQLEVTSPENGQAGEDVPIDYAGGPVTIGFNSIYLIDLLRHLKGNRAELMLGDDKGPTLWRESASAPAFYVLMPMRV